MLLHQTLFFAIGYGSLLIVAIVDHCERPVPPFDVNHLQKNIVVRGRLICKGPATPDDPDDFQNNSALESRVSSILKNLDLQMGMGVAGSRAIEIITIEIKSHLCKPSLS